MRSFGAAVVIVLCCAIGASASPEPPIPDTPAGRVLRAWLTAFNPLTKTNWEGTGVEPDVKVAADQALETATKLAVDRIRNSPAGKN
jgi:hypothetical protein